MTEQFLRWISTVNVCAPRDWGFCFFLLGDFIIYLISFVLKIYYFLII